MKDKIKKIIKKIPGFTFFDKIRAKIRFKNEFINDYSFFKKNYINCSNDPKHIDYDMILIVHSLEKGMANTQLRPFGVEKIKNLICLIEKYETMTNEYSYAYNLSLNCLNEYKKIYEKNDWINNEEYSIAANFLEKHKDYKQIKAGSYDLLKNSFINDAKIDYDKFLSSRHSVRNFDNKRLDEKDIKKAVETAIKTPSACNRQMCKIYSISDKKVIEDVALGLSGFDLASINYFLVTFDVAANYFIGERNQGWFNAGLISMNFINSLHSLGIGSCFIQFGNSFKEEKALKKKLNIPESERIAVIIAAGYYAELSKIPYSSRKEIHDIYFER